jgi:hypothetical protein
LFVLYKLRFFLVGVWAIFSVFFLFLIVVASWSLRESLTLIAVQFKPDAI